MGWGRGRGGGLTEACCFSTCMCQCEEFVECLISSFLASMYDQIQFPFGFYLTWTERFSKRCELLCDSEFLFN